MSFLNCVYFYDSNADRRALERAINDGGSESSAAA